MSVVGIDGAEVVRDLLPDWTAPIREEFLRASRVKRKHFRIWELRKVAKWSVAKIVELLGMEPGSVRRVIRQVERRLREIFAGAGAWAG